MQSRYGWTDAQVMDLPWRRFIGLCLLSSEARKEESRERMIASAFTAWLMGAGEGKRFDQYLKQWALIDIPDFTQADRAEEKATALRDAAKIISLDKHRRRGSL